MRRKPGTILPIERAILEAAGALERAGQREFHGYALARTLADEAGARSLTGHGTLYRALDRMERAGLLSSRWEEAGGEVGKPPRRLYAVTAEGAAALAALPSGDAPWRWSPS